MSPLDVLRRMRDEYAERVEALDTAINNMMADEFAKTMKRKPINEDDAIPPVMMSTRGKKGGIRLR